MRFRPETRDRSIKVKSLIVLVLSVLTLAACDSNTHRYSVSANSSTSASNY